jgi:predicted dehydrogenase
MKKRGAVVGVGYLGTFHAQKYKALSQELGFEFVGVCDATPAQAQKVAADLGVASFSKPEELIGKVDFVTVATSTPYHYELAKLFLKNKIHVNVEKPMTVLVKEAEELVELAKANNVQLAVGHSERFSPVLAEMKSHIQKPVLVELQRHAPFKARGSEVSVILDLMIHDIDLMLSMDPSGVVLTSAAHGHLVSETEDWVTASFSFQSGLRAMISVSRAASAMTRTMKVFSKDKVVIGNFQTGDVEIGSPESREGIQAMAYTTVNAGRGDNLLLETRNFFLAILGKENLRVPGQDGLRALRLAEEVLVKGRV